jgi:hypothetical protein
VKLTKGVTVRHEGKVHKGECPDDVAEAVRLKAKESVVELVKPKPKKEAKP